MNKVSLKGIEIYPFSSESQIADYAEHHPGILVAVNAEKILNQTAETRQIINRNIGYCDGAGPLMALHSLGYKEAIKVAGCELWLSLIEQFHHTKTFYLIGGKQEVIEQTVRKLHDLYADIRIVGYRNGYLSSEEEKAILMADIVAKHPDVVFVAMGSPKQEHVKRAPQWWVNNNLEWFYRLIHQPQRIKRQVKLVKFAWWIIARKFIEK